MTGGIVALVPLRSLTAGKTRLAGVLSAAARESLTRQMVTGVIRSALSSDAIVGVVVVSPDADALALAGETDPRVMPVLQPSDTLGLLAGLDVGRRRTEELGASGL